MALKFGKVRFSEFIGEKGSNWNLEIWKKDNSDVETDGSASKYPQSTASNSFTSSLTGWSQSSGTWAWNAGTDGTGGARHTAGNTAPLFWSVDTNILENGVVYQVVLTIDNRTNGTVRVRLGGTNGTNRSSNGVFTENVTAGGGLLEIVPSSQFDGDVKSIIITKYFAPPTEFKTFTEGFEVTWNGSGGTRDREFLGSDCKINYVVESDVDENFLYSTFNEGYETYFVRIYRGTVANANLWWFGWIQPAFDVIENHPYPYEFQITATDSYGLWGKKKEEFFSGEDQKNASHSIKNILLTISQDMNLNSDSFGESSPVPAGFNWLRTSLDWWSSVHTYEQADPAILYFVSKGFVSKPTTYGEDGDIEEDQEPYKYKPFDVFNGVLKSFNTVGYLAEGHYNFIQPNSLANNTTGDLRTFDYKSVIIGNGTSPTTVNTLLTIDQSNHTILGGSNLYFEPSYERVKANFLGGFSSIDVGSGQDMSTEFYAGSLQSGLNGQLDLNFSARYKEKITKSDFTLTTNYNVYEICFQTTATLTIRISDGTNQRWLVAADGSNVLSWATSASTITIKRGYGVTQDSPLDNASEMCVGPVSNPIPTNGNGYSFGPCDSTGVGFGTIQQFFTEIKFRTIIEYPDISGDIFIQLTADNDYSQGRRTPITATPPVQYDWDFLQVNDPTPLLTQVISENITLTPTEFNEDNDVTNGIIYTASQTQNTAIESFDLGDLNLGQSAANLLYSFKYNSGTGVSPIYQVVPGFQRNNPTPTDYKNATELLVEEFLQLQIEPLEILQADIQSADISPLRLIKYSINNDGSFKYYTFLGGTFKAQSEILSGEWYKVNSVETNITISNEPDTPDPIPQPQTELRQSFNQSAQASRLMLENNSIGFLNATLVNGVADTKLTLSSNIKGKVYASQKLVLTYPDGTNPLILTASQDANTSTAQVDFSSFTPKISYPANSILSPLTYDLSNVITGGGGGANTIQIILKDFGSFLFYLFQDDNWYSAGSSTIAMLGSGTSPSNIPLSTSQNQSRVAAYTAINDCTLKKLLFTFYWTSSAVNSADFDFAFSKFTPITNGTQAIITMNPITATDKNGSYNENKPYQCEFVFSGSNASLTAGDAFAFHMRTTGSTTSVQRVIIYGTAILEVEE